MPDQILVVLSASALEMDATKRPIQINPDFATYAEQHAIFDMYKVSVNLNWIQSKPASVELVEVHQQQISKRILWKSKLYISEIDE